MNYVIDILRILGFLICLFFAYHLLITKGEYKIGALVLLFAILFLRLKDLKKIKVGKEEFEIIFKKLIKKKSHS